MVKRDCIHESDEHSQRVLGMMEKEKYEKQIHSDINLSTKFFTG